jgi:hypothetical protein
VGKLSDEDDNAAGEEVPFDNSRRTREQRIRDFLGVAGLELNDILSSVRKNPIIADVVTDAHRECVIDLRASGATREAVAKFLGISLQMAERIFPWELENGRRLRTGQVSRALLVNAVQLGDTSAMMGYLKNQPEEEWGTKHSQKNIEDPPPAEDEIKRLSQNEAFIAGITAGLSVDTTKFKKAEPRPAAAPKVTAKPKIGYTAGTVRKPKGDLT